MTARILTAVATLAWLVTGLVASRTVLAPAATHVEVPTPSSESATEVVALVGIAEQAAAALVRGDDEGAADMARLARVPGLPVPRVLDTPHYVEDATAMTVRPDGDAWVVQVRVDALVHTADGYVASPPLVVSVPATTLTRGAALAGNPLLVPAGDQPATTDG